MQYDFVIEYIETNCNNGTPCCHRVLIKKDKETIPEFIIMNGIEIAEYFEHYKVVIPQHYIQYINSLN